jgi:hypothetical protein
VNLAARNSDWLTQRIQDLCEVISIVKHAQASSPANEVSHHFN